MSIMVVVLDGSGNILCFSEYDHKRIIALPLCEVTLDNLFVFWSKDINDLIDYYYYSQSLYRNNISPTINIHSCSFLDLHVDDSETGGFWIG